MKLLIFIPIMLISAGVFASPAEEPVEENIPILESAQELLGLKINRVANRLDMFFADQRADDELGRSRLRLRRSYEVRERAIPKEQTQIRFNIKLPHLEEKFRFDYKNKTNTKPGTSVAKNDPNKVQEEWQFRSDIGLSVKVPPNIFTRARLRKNWQTWKVIHRFIQELAWYSDRDWEETSTFDSDYPLEEDMLLRFRHTADWKITRKNFITGHGPNILHRVSEDDAFAYGLTMFTTVKNGSWYVTNFRLAPGYRRNVYKHWLYLDITPGLDFPKTWHFRRTPFIFFQLEALFGG